MPVKSLELHAEEALSKEPRTAQSIGNEEVILSTPVDITAQKQTEEVLRKSAERRRVAEAVGEERQRLFDVLEALPAMICLLTPDHHVAYANRSFRERFGEADGRRCYEYCFGRSKPCNFCESHRVLKTGKSHRWEMKWPNGSVIDVYGIPFTDVDGSPMILEMNTDITAFRRTEEALMAERQRFHDVLDILPAYVVLLTPDYHVPFANRFFETRFGKAEGRRCFEYLFGRTEPCEICETYSVLKTRQSHEWEWTGPDGRNYYIFDFPFTDVNGADSILEVGLDITEKKRTEEELRQAHAELEAKVKERTAALEGEIRERKRAEEALRKNETLLRAVTDNNPDPIFMKDSRGRLVYANPATLRMIGKTIDDVIGKTDEDFYVNTADGRAIMENDRRIMDSRQSEIVEESLSNPDGSKRFYISSKAPFYDARGQILGLIGVGHEITDRKLAEEALRDRESRYRQLALRLEQVREEERAALARELHDDLGQVLAGLGFDLAWINKRMSNHDGEVKRKVENIREYVRTALQRLRMVYTQLRPGLLDEMGLSAAIESHISSFQEKSGILTILETHIDERVLNTDQITTLFRIIQESLTNVFKHAKASEVNVSLSQKNGDLVLMVADNGKGIRKSDLKKQHSFGLVGIEERIKKLGGEFDIQGKAGKGTVLTVSIPVSGCPKSQVSGFKSQEKEDSELPE